MIGGIDPRNAFKHDEQHAENDEDEQDDVEPLAHGGVGLIYNFVDFMLPALFGIGV